MDFTPVGSIPDTDEGPPRLLRCVAAGSRAQRAAVQMGGVGTVHAEAIDALRGPVPPRDARACRAAPDRRARRAVIAGRFRGRVLLRGRVPLPPLGPARVADGGWRAHAVSRPVPGLRLTGREA